MFARAWLLANDCVQAFIDDGALSRGASIAFYASTSLGPVLLVVVAIAGLAFGEDAARGSVVGGVTLFVTVSGVFGEMQSALNAIW
jgi:membrane protein